MKVALIQQTYCGDRDKNIAKLTENIRKCAAEGADLLVLSELHNSLYFCQTENVDNFDLAEPIDGYSTHRDLAHDRCEKRSRGIWQRFTLPLGIERTDAVCGITSPASVRPATNTSAPTSPSPSHSPSSTAPCCAF